MLQRLDMIPARLLRPAACATGKLRQKTGAQGANDRVL